MAFSVPYTFEPGEVISSAQVNANFEAIVNALNDGGGSSLVPGNGHIILPGGLIVQWGFATAVPADGSAPAAISFDLEFPNALLGKPICGISNDFQSNPIGVGAAQTTAETASGFNVNVQGGGASSTVTVSYIAVGY